MHRSGSRVDRLFRIPGVQQRADFDVGQFAAAFEPGFDSGTLLFADRATLGRAHQTEVITANVIEAVGIHGFSQEGVEEGIDGFVGQVFLETQVQFETQLLALTIQGQVSLSFQTTNHGHISLNLLRKRK